MAVPADCTRCGICCTSEGQRHVAVTGDDWSRLGEHAEDVTEWIGNKAFMKMVDGHCAALTAHDEGRYLCSMYEVRPETCRALPQASAACEAEIERKRQRARLPIAR